GRLEDRFLPEALAGAALQAHDDAIPVLLQTGGQEDAVAVHDGGRMTDAWDGHLPGDVVGAAPRERQVLFERRAVQAWAAPAGPVFRTNRRTDASKNGARKQCRPQHECPPKA